MEYKVGDLVKLDKKHPCGCDIWEIIRIGMDIKLRCNKCHRIIILGRAQFVDLLVSVEAKEKVKFKPSNLHNTLSDGKNWIQNIQNPTIDDMKQSVKENAMTIRFINNPPDEVIRIAIEQNPMCTQYLDMSDIVLQKYAVDKTVGTLQNIKNPSNEIISYAIKKNPELMRKYAKKPNGNIVKINNSKMTAELLKNIFTDSAEIKRKIVERDGRFIGYINAPDDSLKELAIESTPLALEFISKPTEKLIEKAESLAPRQLERFIRTEDGNVHNFKEDKSSEYERYINKLPYGKLKKRIINNPYQIKYVHNPDVELQKIAITKDILSLRYIKVIHPDILQYLYDDPDFDVYSFTDDFGLQLKIVTQFEKIKKTRESIYKQEAIDKSIEKPGELHEDYENKLHEIWDVMNRQREESGCSTKLVSNEIPISAYINYFGEKISCKTAKIASGFLYKSGLKMIEPIIQRISRPDESSLELIVGSLKDYFHASTDNKLVNIDLDTAKLLNEYISKNICNIYTLEERFYHGKYFFFEGAEASFCIVGSSNLTYSGFAGNYELNTLYYMKNGTEQYESLKQWFEDFLRSCTKLDNLSECNFADTNMKFDTINAGTSIESVDLKSIENEIQSLTDEEQKFRLNLWLDKKPTNIYRRLDIENLKDYVAFEFKEHKLVVFESFEAGNGYYYFHGDNIFELVQKVKDMSKTQIFELAGMEKRGYHIKDRKVLKKKIYGLFVSKEA